MITCPALSQPQTPGPALRPPVPTLPTRRGRSGSADPVLQQHRTASDALLSLFTIAAGQAAVRACCHRPCEQEPVTPGGFPGHSNPLPLPAVGRLGVP